MSDNFANQLRVHRKNLGISQEELAERLDITPQSVSKWESGKSYPDTKKLIEAAKILGVSLDTLVFGNDTCDEDVQRDTDKGDGESLERVEKAVNSIQSTIELQRSEHQEWKKSKECAKRTAVKISVIAICSVLLTVGIVLLSIYIYRGTPAYIFEVKEVEGGVEITSMRNSDRILKDGHLEIPSKIGKKSVVSIGCEVFYGNKEIKSVKIPDTVTKIDKFAFANCDMLERVDMGNGVEHIEMAAFMFCRSLESIKLSNKLESISTSVFFSAIQLEEIVLPSSIKLIDTGVFFGCDKLKRVYFCNAPEEIRNVSIDSFQNHDFISAEWYYYSEVKPSSDGVNYFYFDENGNIAHWNEE